MKKTHKCRPKWNGEVFKCACGKVITIFQVESVLYCINNSFEKFIDYLAGIKKKDIK